MSEKKLMLAAMLIALILCLSACGKNEDTSADSSQTVTGQSYSETKGTVSATAPSASFADAGSSEGGNDKEDSTKAIDFGTGFQNSGADEVGNGNPAAQTGEGDESGQNSSGGAVSQSSKATGADSPTSRIDNQQGSKPDAPDSTSTLPDSPEERDNAEVNINDL